jgi:hypothetical protein
MSGQVARFSGVEMEINYAKLSEFAARGSLRFPVQRSNHILLRVARQIRNVALLIPSSGGADPSPSHSCGEHLHALGGAPVQDGASKECIFVPARHLQDPS